MVLFVQSEDDVKLVDKITQVLYLHNPKLNFYEQLAGGTRQCPDEFWKIKNVFDLV